MTFSKDTYLTESLILDWFKTGLFSLSKFGINFGY